MKEFIKSIEILILNFGKSAVSEDRFFNTLKDVYNFKDTPDYYTTLKAAYANNVIRVICKTKKRNIKKVVQTQAMIISKKDSNLKIDVVKEVLFSFAIAIKILSYQEYIAIDNNNPNTNPYSFFSRVWQSIDKTILINNVLFLCTSIVGLLVFLIGNMWPFFAILTIAIFDFIYYGFVDTAYLLEKKSNLALKASIYACFSVVAIKTFLLFFAVSNRDASFLTYLLLIIMLFLWISPLIDGEPFTHLKSKSGRKVYFVNLIFMLLIIGGIIFYPLILNGLNSIRNMTLQVVRSYEKVDLGFGQYKLGRTLNVKGAIDADSIKINDCIANDSVYITVYTHNEKISRVIIEPISGWEQNYSYIKIFKEKYGTPEYIRNDFFSDYVYDYTLQWNFKNGSIILMCAHSWFEEENVQSIEYISKEAIDINKKAQVIAEQEREKQALIKEKKEEKRLDSIEQERLKIEYQEKLKNQKVKQQIKDRI